MAGLSGWADELDVKTVVRLHAWIHVLMLADPGMTGDATTVWASAWSTVRDFEDAGVLHLLERVWRLGCEAGCEHGPPWTVPWGEN